MKNLLLLLTSIVLIISCSKKTGNEWFADQYNVSVKTFNQCVDEWGGTKIAQDQEKDDREAWRVAKYIGSKGFLGFFQPSCDGSIKQEFINYKTAYLSAPINGKPSEECKQWRKPKALRSLSKKNCLLEDFLLLHLEGGLTPEEISIKNAEINAPYYTKIEQEKNKREQEKNKRRQQCAAKRHPCDYGNGSLDRLCMSQPGSWIDSDYFFYCPVEYRRRY
jgi:hypothetical protein